MTNYEFARRVALIAKRATSWNFDTMCMGRAFLDKEAGQQALELFCKEISEMLDEIKTDGDTP